VDEKTKQQLMLTQIIMRTCINHRTSKGVMQPPKEKDCEMLPCADECPVAMENNKYVEWMKKEYKLRKEEERELMKVGV
jgi:hypothetical protein